MMNLARRRRRICDRIIYYLLSSFYSVIIIHEHYFYDGYTLLGLLLHLTQAESASNIRYISLIVFGAHEIQTIIMWFYPDRFYCSCDSVTGLARRCGVIGCED